MIITAIFIPQVVVLSFSSTIFHWFGQDPEVCLQAQRYIVRAMLGMYFQGLYDLNKRWLNCLKITWVPMIAQTCGTLIHIGWCHLFTVRLQYGVEGLGYANTITYLTMLVMITVNTLLIRRIR